jgi:hypothetical protein
MYRDLCLDDGKRDAYECLWQLNILICGEDSTPLLTLHAVISEVTEKQTSYDTNVITEILNVNTATYF